MKDWVMMPSYWIRDKESTPLRNMKWSGPDKTDNIAALMLFIAMNHHANNFITIDRPKIGRCVLTYTQLTCITGLSRAKVASGLRVLKKLGIISEINQGGRNNIYQIENYGANSGWAKLPAKGMYSEDLQKINAFQKFHLRSKNELNALKIYYIIIAFRNNDSNYATISYEKIVHYTGINRNEIKAALSLIINLGLIHVDTRVSEVDYNTVNMYRLCYLESYKHRGTTARNPESM